MHQQFVTTSRGLRRDLPPMRLFEKAKKLGIWNPADIDLTQDVADWQQLTEYIRDPVRRLTGMFMAGEEAVTLDLLPLIMAIAKEGRLEEEMFLTTFLFEEAKHVDFFQRVTTALHIDPADLERYHTENYRIVFYDALPNALSALMTDPSPQAQVRASMTYNVVVEGMLAETGYHALFTILEREDVMPGLREGVRLLKQDESRHIAYGIYLLSRLITADPDLWETAEETMNELFIPALGVVGEVFEAYEDNSPAGLDMDEFIEYATGQFNKRMERVTQAREGSMEDVIAITRAAIAADDA